MTEADLTRIENKIKEISKFIYSSAEKFKIKTPPTIKTPVFANKNAQTVANFAFPIIQGISRIGAKGWNGAMVVTQLSTKGTNWVLVTLILWACHYVFKGLEMREGENYDLLRTRHWNEWSTAWTICKIAFAVIIFIIICEISMSIGHYKANMGLQAFFSFILTVCSIVVILNGLRAHILNEKHNFSS